MALSAPNGPALGIIRIGTRRSALALTQAEEVCRRLQALDAKVSVELVPMMTSGDRTLDQPLAEIGGKGLFTKEIEDALLDGRIDLAVHSAKDMQTQLPPGLALAAVPPREDARDVLIAASGAAHIKDLPQGARLGTSSLRRAAQALHVRPDLRIVSLRGNVQTRLAKLERGEADAILLAAAGLKRLGISPLPGHPLPLEEMLPAAAQAALGLECREGDARMLSLLAPLNDADAAAAVAAERSLLAALEGSCRMPIAAYAQCMEENLRLRAMLLAPDGAWARACDVTGKKEEAEALGRRAGAVLKENG